MTGTTSLLFICGVGYTGSALARIGMVEGWSVLGTARRADDAKKLRDAGIVVVMCDASGPGNVPEGAHWVITVPPDEMGCPIYRQFPAQVPHAASVTYLSTTGVYGDLGGGWAFEWTDPAPESDRAERRLVAEEQWLTATGGLARLVRLPGIYGPGRSAMTRLRAGRARQIIKPGQVFSRIHRDDLVSGLLSLIRQPAQRGVFHLCDDTPAPPQAVIRYAAELLRLPPPEETAFADADLSEMARSFYAECKRISNARTKAALGWRPVYPSYEEGLAAIMTEATE